MAMAMLESGTVARAPTAVEPWVLVHLTGEEALAHVAKLAVEIFRPLIRLPRRVPQNRLSARQRQAGAVVRLRLLPLFPRCVFLRGPQWFDALDTEGVLGALAGAGGLPLAIPASLVDRVEAYMDASGAVPSEISPRRLLGLPADVAICPEREPRFCHVMSVALDQPLRIVDREILVRLIGYICRARRGEGVA